MYRSVATSAVETAQQEPLEGWLPSNRHIPIALVSDLTDGCTFWPMNIIIGISAKNTKQFWHRRTQESQRRMISS